MQLIPHPDSAPLKGLKQSHLDSLSAPLDAYWEEALIGLSDHFEIRLGDQQAGFTCLNSDNQIVAFFVVPRYARHARELLEFIIRDRAVSGALVGTNDSEFLCLCLDLARDITVHTLLFREHEEDVASHPNAAQYSFRKAELLDFEHVFHHYRDASGDIDLESVENGYEDLRGYLDQMLKDHAVFLLWEGQNVIASSECRFSKTQQGIADVGMIVAHRHRRKGLGRYILGLTKDYCHQNQRKSICSCEAENVGSRKAIENAGFVSYHRILQVQFQVPTVNESDTI